MDCSVAKHLDYTSSSSSSSGSSSSSSKRDRPEGTRTLVCVDCRTSRTPLWRCGPSGPKSLCNACGIRYLRRTKAVDDKHNSRGSISNSGCNKTSVLSKLGFGRELLQKQRSLLRLRRRRRLGEEEKAAVLLMAISSGLIYSVHEHQRHGTHDQQSLEIE